MCIRQSSLSRKKKGCERKCKKKQFRISLEKVGSLGREVGEYKWLGKEESLLKENERITN